MPISVASPKGFSTLAPPLRALVRATLAGEGRRAGEFGIVLTDDPTVRALNHRWRGLDKATDVLSFGYDDVPGSVVHGDLVISMDRVAVQARRFRVSRGRELARLAIHGTLHLVGLDHARPRERAAMRARETRALRAAAALVRGMERALDRD